MAERAEKDPDRGFILRVNSCLTPLEQIHNASILCRDGVIQAVGAYSALRVLEDIPCIDLSACHVVPGLIDTHLHGTGGFAAMRAEEEGDMSSLSRVLASHGVTSFVITALAAPGDELLAVTAALARCHEQAWPGAVPVGVHLEGPYLNPQKSGAQIRDAIRPVDLGEARELIQAGAGRIRIMTFAPELAHSRELIELLLEHGIVPSMGHSTANEEEAVAAVEAGARRCTHFFNGMPALTQRESSLTLVGLTDDRLTIELIIDGVHVHPRMIGLTCRVKPQANVVGVSDATQGAGLADGIYAYGAEKIVIRDGVSRRLSDGVLAGSALTLDAAMRNLERFSGLSQSEGLACFTTNAASSIGLHDRGIIKPGKRADLVVLDERREVQMTIVNGRVVYDRRDSAS
jgi:N-acetylglucosamine-6-phosphate deacetylase